jgi:hypothetical protein
VSVTRDGWLRSKEEEVMAKIKVKVEMPLLDLAAGANAVIDATREPSGGKPEIAFGMLFVAASCFARALNMTEADFMQSARESYRTIHSMPIEAILQKPGQGAKVH